MQRRKLLATTAGLLAGGTAYATVGITPVFSANLSIDDATWTAPGGDVHSPLIDLTLDWRYSGVSDAHAIMTALLYDDGLATSTLTDGVSAPSDSGSVSFSQPVVASRNWDPSDWQPPSDSQVSHPIAVEARLEVRDEANNTLTKAQASETVTVTVKDGEPKASASLSGSGDVLFLATEGGTPRTPDQ